MEEEKMFEVIKIKKKSKNELVKEEINKQIKEKIKPKD